MNQRIRDNIRVYNRLRKGDTFYTVNIGRSKSSKPTLTKYKVKHKKKSPYYKFSHRIYTPTTYVNMDSYWLYIFSNNKKAREFLNKSLLSYYRDKKKKIDSYFSSLEKQTTKMLVQQKKIKEKIRELEEK